MLGVIDNSDYEETQGLCFDANNFYGYAKMQYLPYGGFKVDAEFEESVEDITLNLADVSDTGSSRQVDLNQPDTLKQKTMWFPCCAEHEDAPEEEFTDCMDNETPNCFMACSKLICDQTTKKQ